MGDNLLIHIRFWYWHLQIGEKFSSVRWHKNRYFYENKLKGEWKIEVYKFFNSKKTKN